MWPAAIYLLTAFAATMGSNAGFEEASAGGTAGWTSDDIEGATWHRVEREEARSGRAVMQLRGTGLRSDVKVRLMSEPVPVRGGDAIAYECWIRSDGAPRHDLSVYVEGMRGEQWEALPPVSDMPQSDRWLREQWTPRSYTAFVPAGVTQVRGVCAGPLAHEHRVTWFIDDFTVRVISVPDYIAKAEGQKMGRLPDIYLASPDALSQSVLGCYGSKTPTREIDWLAEHGRQYEQVTTPSPWTKPSFASIMTSMYPSQHRVQDVHYALPEEAETLAEMLRARGYFTAAFVWAPYDGYLGPYMQFNQGFDVFFFSDDEALVSEAALRFLETNAENFRGMQHGGLFMWHHIWEPHTPYLNRHPAMHSNPEGKLGPVDVTDAILNRAGWWGKPHQGYVNEADIGFISDTYHGEAAFTSDLIGQVLSRFHWAGLLEKLNVVLCADHGESFGERPQTYGHSHGYETCLRTPLIFRLPGKVREGQYDRKTLVSNLDIMPTLLEVAGIAVPDYLEGRSLLREASPGDLTAVYGISESRRHGYLTVRDARYKLVVRNASKGIDDENLDHRWSFDDGEAKYELYDLDKDPLEHTDLSGQDAENLGRLKAALEAHCARNDIHCSADENRENQRALSEAMVEHMTTLGYMGDVTRGPAPELPEVKVGTEGGFGNLKGL